MAEEYKRRKLKQRSNDGRTMYQVKNDNWRTTRVIECLKNDDMDYAQDHRNRKKAVDRKRKQRAREAALLAAGDEKAIQKRDADAIKGKANSASYRKRKKEAIAAGDKMTIRRHKNQLQHRICGPTYAWTSKEYETAKEKRLIKEVSDLEDAKKRKSCSDSKTARQVKNDDWRTTRVIDCLKNDDIDYAQDLLNQKKAVDRKRKQRAREAALLAAGDEKAIQKRDEDAIKSKTNSAFH